MCKNRREEKKQENGEEERLAITQYDTREVTTQSSSASKIILKTYTKSKLFKIEDSNDIDT